MLLARSGGADGLDQVQAGGVLEEVAPGAGLADVQVEPGEQAAADLDQTPEAPQSAGSALGRAKGTA